MFLIVNLKKKGKLKFFLFDVFVDFLKLFQLNKISYYINSIVTFCYLLGFVHRNLLFFISEYRNTPYFIFKVGVGTK
jgi:hypothetical protein